MLKENMKLIFTSDIFNIKNIKPLEVDFYVERNYEEINIINDISTQYINSISSGNTTYKVDIIYYNIRRNLMTLYKDCGVLISGVGGTNMFKIKCFCSYITYISDMNDFLSVQERRKLKIKSFFKTIKNESITDN
jgi:hypothetical protein